MPRLGCKPVATHSYEEDVCSENIASLCGSERATILPSYKHMFVADVRAELKSPLPAAPKKLLSW